MIETIRLFKALPVEKKIKKKPTQVILEHTLKHGFIFSEEIYREYSNEELIKMLPQIIEEVGLSQEQMNATFHKSWKKVKEAPMEQLIIEQMIHYLTTYGFEHLGIYNENTVYLPDEKLEMPDVDFSKIKLTLIKGYNKEELKDKLKSLGSGIALKGDTVKDFVAVAKFVELKGEDIEGLNNREVRTALYSELKIIPKDPTEFLRYVLYNISKKTLLIKDKSTIEAFKNQEHNLLKQYYLSEYKKAYGLEPLAEVFYRYKPIFLAMKHKETANIINRIRKLADIHHKPMKADFLNNITAMKKVDDSKLDKALKKSNMFRKARLLYTLNYRVSDVDNIVYRIRNGKAWADSLKDIKNKTEMKRVYKIIENSLIEDLKKNVKGKTILVSEPINYALPTTEKQFVGDIPSGSFVEVDKDMIFGVHWNNLPDYRVDLDLSIINIEGKIGWDGGYRNDGGSVLFSGDITDAPKPNGATELFYVKKQLKDAYIVMNNFFNHMKDKQVPYHIIVAKETPRNFKGNYMAKQENVLVKLKTKTLEKQQMIGLVTMTTKRCRFYFVESRLDNGISARNSKATTIARQYLQDYYENTICLNELLKKAGAKLKTKLKKDEKPDYDLTLENLEKDSFLKIMTKK